MSLEGLEAILNKEEIVATQRPADLIDRPEMVDGIYTKHVRSYIPLGRQSQDGEDGQSVNKFEKRVIREVKSAAALRGYITAEYGYGKTSTALYLWKRSREANLLAVPPFQMTQLQDLITATYGWLHYEVKRVRPDSDLLKQTQELYSAVTERSAESLAKQYGFEHSKIQRLIVDRPELLTLKPGDYLKFFEEATHIACQAGFEGLLVLADEVQQYIDPEVKTGVKDPISPLFDVISNLLTRKNHLKMGIILVLPPKELDVLRDQRGDFIHRTLQVSLDLRTIYDREFPNRLWYRLADEFGFSKHSCHIVTDSTLDALGQIGVRTDLSDGPRTVINTFRRMARRYLELGNPSDDPYTPYHLINDFLMGQIEFDSAKKIQRVTNQALGHSLVKGHPERERAIKWAAAFPEEGISRSLQESLNLTKAFDELMQSAQGDLVISVGDIKHRGITLRGLDQVETDIGWLPTTIREFWRIYDENVETTQSRAIRAFLHLLTEKVFPNNHWKVLETTYAGLTRNNGLILEGSFPSYSRQFPERRVHVKILWEDEQIKDVGFNGEFLIQFRLRRYLDWTEGERRLHSEPLEIQFEPRQINVTLNLMYRDESNISPTLDKLVTPIVSPYKLTPLLMLSLYELINEKRANNTIPKVDDQSVQYAFQPDLLDNIFQFLFNSDVGRPVDASQERIIDLASNQLLEAMYPEYDSLMIVTNWTSSLGKYRNALKHLELSHERQGQIAVEGNKDEIAELFTLTNTTLDTFISNFSSLITVQQPFPNQREAKEGKKGAVRFQLHSLEEKIKKWLLDSPDTQNIQIGNQSHQVHVMPTNQVYRQAQVLGYKDKEIDEILILMEDRGLVVQDRRGTIREEINQAPSIDELAAEVSSWQKDVKTLLEVFNQHQLRSWSDETEKFTTLVNQTLRQKPDDEKAIRARRAVQVLRRQLDDFVKDQHQRLIDDVDRFIKTIPQPNPQHGKALNNSVMGGVSYVAQVNDLRSRLVRQISSLNNEYESYIQQIKTLAASLKSPNLGIPTLVKLSKDYQSLQGGVEPLREKCDSNAKDFERFNDWGRLVKDGSELSDQLQEMGDAVRGERDKFQKLSQDIMGHLSANKTAALPDAPNFENRLREISEAVRVIKAQASDRFAKLQERYQIVLINSFKFPRDKLWPPFSYNPADPDDSYNRLTNNVKNSLTNLYHRLSDQLKNLQDEIRFVLQSPLLKTVEDKEDLETNGKSLLQELDQVTKQMSEIEVMLNDTAVIRDFPEHQEGAFLELLNRLSSVLDKVTGNIAKEINRLGYKLRDFALEGDEEVVLSKMSHSSQIEFNDLRQGLSLSEDALWKALRGLYTKRRIRLPIEPIKYD